MSGWPIKIADTQSQYPTLIQSKRLEALTSYMRQFLQDRVVDNENLIDRAILLLANSYANPGKRNSLTLMGPPPERGNILFLTAMSKGFTETT